MALIAIICIALTTNAQTIKNVKAADAYDIITKRDTAATMLIDGRTAAMFAEKHIQGATCINAFQEDLAGALHEYMDVKTLIVYCSNHRRSDTIIAKLKELNYNGKIIFISDGINGWIAAGFETIKPKIQ